MVKYKNTNYEKKIKETEEIKLKPREKSGLCPDFLFKV